jgi:hypothetical protein
MVTGVETAGLVLAVFPVVVEGLKAYLEGIESIKRWWKYVSVLKHLIRVLRMEEAKFSNTCTELLHDLVPAPELALLLEKPGGWRWRDADLQINLKQRLGRGFHAYLEAITDMTDILDEFRRKLDLGPNDKVQLHSRAPCIQSKANPSSSPNGSNTKPPNENGSESSSVYAKMRTRDY